MMRYFRHDQLRTTTAALALLVAGTCAKGQICGIRTLDLREPFFPSDDQRFALAHSISGDGSTVVGFGSLPGGAARWTADSRIFGMGQVAGFPYTVAEFVSDNGGVIFGSGWNDDFTVQRVFRYDVASLSIQDLGALTGYPDLIVRAVSADGNVAIGEMFRRNSSIYRAFRWTSVDGLQQLETLGNGFVFATGLSADGDVVVGYHQNTQWGISPFRWSATEGLRVAATSCQTFPVLVSADGNVVVYGHFGRIWRWTVGVNGAPDTLLEIAPLSGLSDEIEGNLFAVSADGSVVVGRTRSPTGYLEAFRWTLEGGVEYIHAPNGLASWATNVSADGRVVSGILMNAEGYRRAFRWTRDDGLQVSSGIFGDTHDIITTDMSNDGNVIVGHVTGGSVYRHAFRWTETNCRCPADLDGDGDLGNDLVPFLVAFQEGNRSADVDNDGEPSASAPDGAVTVDDLLYFLSRFEMGC